MTAAGVNVPVALTFSATGFAVFTASLAFGMNARQSARTAKLIRQFIG
jgi:hypothetical protein